jgi:hypothetical protein
VALAQPRPDLGRVLAAEGLVVRGAFPVGSAPRKTRRKARRKARRDAPCALRQRVRPGSRASNKRARVYAACVHLRARAIARLRDVWSVAHAPSGGLSAILCAHSRE